MYNGRYDGVGTLTRQGKSHICIFFTASFFFEWVFGFGLRASFSGEGLSFRKTLTRLVMTTSVRFTRVLCSGQNEYFIYISLKFFFAKFN